MGIVDLSFLFDLESRLRVIQEDEYSRMAASENMWWDTITKVRPSASRKELIFWILSQATIEPQGKGGNVQFDDMQMVEADYTNLDAGKGLKIQKNLLDDLDGNGVDVAEAWVRQVSAYAAYWPQKQIAKLILAGEGATAKSYDGVPFFSAAHPTNGIDTSKGTFKNLFTGADALPIHDSGTGAVSLDTAFANVGKAIAYIKGIRMPNGQDPRFLVPRFLIVPPALQSRAVQLTNAKFIAQAAASGGGSADVEALVKRWGLNTPIVADEFSSTGTGQAADDTSWYIGCEQMTSTQLGALVYVDREPFKITYYTGDGGGTGVDAILDRSRELEWHTHGRNVAGYGHPYALFKFKAT